MGCVCMISYTTKNMDKKNQKEAQAEKGNKIMYTDSQIGIYNSKNNVEEYRIKVHFE